MEKRHKDLLRRNLVEFGDDLQVTSALINHLEAGGILSKHDVETLQNPITTRSDKASWLMTQLRMKGPQAFDAFYNSLVDTEQEHLADLLKPPEFRLARINREGRGHIPQSSEHGTRAIHSQETHVLPLEWPSLETLADKVEVTDVDDEGMRRKFAEGNTDDLYKMSSSPRGRAIIFNMETFKNEDGSENVTMRRKGSTLDQKSLWALLRDLNFKCVVHRNLSAEDILEKLTEEKEDERHKNYDCFMVVIMSHGNDGDLVYGSDNQPVSLKEVKTMFNGENCPCLAGKPKIFIIQACKGGQVDPGTSKEQIELTPGGKSAMAQPVGQASDENVTQLKGLQLTGQVDPGASKEPTELTPGGKSAMAQPVGQPSDNSQSTDAKKISKDEKVSSGASLNTSRSIPRDADVIVVSATTSEMVSYRDTRLGSWFIQALVYVLMKHAHREDLQAMVTKVNALVSRGETTHGHKQVSSTESTLRRKVYFFPGLTQ